MANKVGTAGGSLGALTDIDTALRNPLGTMQQDEDGGEYIYLQGIGSTVANAWVTYDENFLTALLAANAVGPVAIAQAAVLASQYGWYCRTSPAAGITGIAGDLAADKACYIDAAVSGSVDDAVVTGDLVCGAFSRTVDTLATTSATFQIRRPFVTDVLG